MPSRNRSRKERWRLGPGPVIMWLSLLGDDDEELKNFVGLKCCWDSFSECDGDDDLKLKLVLLNGERCWCCFGELSSRDVAICVNRVEWVQMNEIREKISLLKSLDWHRQLTGWLLRFFSFSDWEKASSRNKNKQQQSYKRNYVSFLSINWRVGSPTFRVPPDDYATRHSLQLRFNL